MSDTKQEPSSIGFRIGAANAPNSRLGRDELDVFRDGRVVYRSLQGASVRSVTARLAPSATDKLFAAFVAAPFPRPLDGMISPGGLVELTAKLPGGDAYVDLDYHVARKAPGYDVVIRTLNGWADALRPPGNKRAAAIELTEIVDLPG